jgi:HK97 family phage portal protein
MDYGTSEVVAGVYLAGPPAQRYSGGYSLENPNLPLNDPAVWDAVFGDAFGTDVGINITAEKALMYAPLYRGVQLISGDVAKLPRYVYKRRSDLSEDARERDRGHRLNYILNVAANEYTEAIKFWCRFMVDALLYQNAYARIYFDGAGNVAELYNLLPDRTAPEWIDGQLWYVTEAGGKLTALFPWEVLHIEGLALGGTASALFRMARNSIALGLAQEKFASKFFANGGRVGGVLELPLSMPKAARDTLEEGFRKTYEGTDNPFKTVILRDNAKFHAAQQSPEQSQMVEATEAQTRAIAHWLNLAPSKLGLSDSVSYNSKSEDNQDYLDTTLQIWLTRIESACNFRLVSERQSDTHFVEHNTSKLLRMNRLQLSQIHASDIASRLRNPNECRAELNMLPYEGGDEFVNPNTMKSGNEPGEEPKEEPKEKPKEPPKRDAAYLRVLFGITARARDKAKRPKAFLEWIDGNLQPHRDEWRHLWGERPFPFDYMIKWFRAKADVCTADELPSDIEQLCEFWENEGERIWNAE